MDNKNNIFIVMLILGSICGLIEVVGKGLLAKAGIHLSGLLIGLDCILIGMALAMYRKPLMIVGLGLIACLSKQLAMPILCVPFMCKANACLAVMLEFGTLAGVAYFTLNKMKTSKNARILTAGSGIFLSSILFYSIGMNVRPCPYLLTFNVPGGFSSFILKEGLVWAAFSAALFPVGWLAGEKLKERILNLSVRSPRFFYAGATLGSVFCWVACAVAISLGI